MLGAHSQWSTGDVVLEKDVAALFCKKLAFSSCLLFSFNNISYCRFYVPVIHSSTPLAHKNLLLRWSLLLLCVAGFFICDSCYFVQVTGSIWLTLSSVSVNMCAYKLLMGQGIINLSWLIETCWDGDTQTHTLTLTQSVPNCRVKPVISGQKIGQCQNWCQGRRLPLNVM